MNACSPIDAGPLIQFALDGSTWVVGFFNALMHARDAWASMPGGLVLSVIVALLAGVATWFGFATPRIRGRK